MNGEHLRKKLVEQSVDFMAVAKELGISPQSLQNRLKAKDVKISFIVELAKAINKSVYYFIQGSGLEQAFLDVNSNLSRGNTDQKDISVESLLISTLKEKIDKSFHERLEEIDEKIDYIHCFLEAIKIKFEIDEELKKTMSSLKKNR